MGINEIEKLLARYYEGTTTRQEEEELKRFFASARCLPGHLEADRRMFNQLGQAAGIPPATDLGERLENLIDQWDADEQRSLKREKRARNVRLQWLAGIAASLLIAGGIGLHLQRPALQDTCATPEEAYAQAQKAIVMLSTGLHKGMAGVAQVEAATGRIQENIQQQLNLLNHKQQ